jgi:hypothetical protein
MPSKEQEHPATRHVREFLGVLRKSGEIKGVRRVKGGVAVEHQPLGGPAQSFVFKAKPKSEVVFGDQPTHSMLVDHLTFNDYFNRLLGKRRKLRFEEVQKALGEPLSAAPAPRGRKGKGRRAEPAPDVERPKLELPEETPVESYGNERDLAELIEHLAESEATPARTWKNFGLLLNELTQGERALTDVVLTPQRVLLQYNEGTRQHQLEIRADKKVEKVMLPGKPKPFQVELHHGRTHSLLSRIFSKRGLHYLEPGERLTEIFKMQKMAVVREETGKPLTKIIKPTAKPEVAVAAAAAATEQWRRQVVEAQLRQTLQKHHEAGWYLRGVSLDPKSAILTWFRRPGAVQTSDKVLVDVERNKKVTRALFGAKQAHDVHQDSVYRALIGVFGERKSIGADEVKKLLVERGVWPAEAPAAKPVVPVPRPPAGPKPEHLRRVLAKHYLANLNLTMVHVTGDRAHLSWTHARGIGHPIPETRLVRVDDATGAKRFLQETPQVADVDQAGLFKDLRNIFGAGMTHGEKLAQILARHGLLPAPRPGV